MNDAVLGQLIRQGQAIKTPANFQASQATVSGSFTLPAGVSSFRVGTEVGLDSGWLAFSDLTLTGWSDTIATTGGHEHTLDLHVAGDLQAAQGQGGKVMVHYPNSSADPDTLWENPANFNSSGSEYSLSFTPPAGITEVQFGYMVTMDRGWLAYSEPELQRLRPEYTITRKTYALGGKTIATRISGNIEGDNGLFYIHSDHLGSTSVMSYGQGHLQQGQEVPGSNAHYLPFGDWRVEPSHELTDQGFTGQKHNMDLGLYYYNARFYLPGIGRFASADTIVPDPMNPQQFNRYTYVLNNPLRFTDPTGHYCYDPSSGADLVGTCIHDDGTTYNLSPWTLPSQKPDGLKPDGIDAWNGLNTLQNMANAWWGNPLNALEAMMILLEHEFGVELYWLDFPQDVIDVAVNKYNLYCQAGPWSTSCMNGWWGYSQVIREHTAPPGGGDRLKLYPDYVSRLRELAQGILNHRVEAVNTSLTHYGNAFGSTKDVMTVDYQNGVHKYSSYLSSSGPNSIFAIQTDIQHCRTGTLEDWNGIERPGCGR